MWIYRLNFTAADQRLDLPRKPAAWQQNAVLATAATDTDVSAQAHNFPFVTTTGMRLAHLHYIPQADVLVWHNLSSAGYYTIFHKALKFGTGRSIITYERL
jgi:hypothetical protein